MSENLVENTLSLDVIYLEQPLYSEARYNDHLFPKNLSVSLRQHAYSNILKILQPKTENFQTKIMIFFLFLLKT